MKNLFLSMQILFILIFSVISLYANQDVYLIGTRKDIRFLTAEGDIMRPLAYQYSQANINFISIDIDSADNRTLFSKQLSDLENLEGVLPALAVGTTLLFDQTLTYEDAEQLIKTLLKNNKKTISQRTKTAIPTRNFSQATAAVGHFTAGIVIIFTSFIIYQSRKRLLRK